ncbi:WGR domain-containing protein [Methylobacterium sp. WSM2598]|uniref:WGR domain-containing protein n=1 Tax=Methylobacterium sp. WSM2598 TaxID=398261 RepID=UPI0003A39A30|nr:WGR domain-containing protein [Methylobacterium sp. WSM2598]
MPFHLIRIDPDKNMARFYRIDVQPNLFGQFAAVRQWGRIGTEGRVTETWHDSEKAADDAAALALTRKLKRGYVPR